MLKYSEMIPEVLILDDEEPIRQMTRQLLENNYSCASAASVAEARECLKDCNFEVILCDINMPGESGIDFIRYAAAEYPDTAVIMVTGVDDPETAETALEIGAYGYIIKPFRRNELIINIQNSLRRRKLEITDRCYREDLERMVTERTAKLRKVLEGIIQAMSLTVESVDLYTAGHQRRVADLATAIAGEMGLSRDRIEGIRMAGMIHDIGKISIPAGILSKPGRLTEYEFGMIRSHPQVGFDILKQIEFPWPIAQIVYQHHERIDGSGYPQGLSGEKILLEAKILGVADVVEAMAMHRPYRPAFGIEKALEEISQNKGLLYDPDVVDACLKLFKEKRFEFR
jgi:putative two-component system response regulator